LLAWHDSSWARRRHDISLYSKTSSGLRLIAGYNLLWKGFTGRKAQASFAGVVQGGSHEV
jgi:hypothetical protein